MHYRIIRALIAKEWHRHLANRGGIALALLLVAAAVLLSVTTKRGGAKGAAGGAAGLVGGVNHCLVQYDKQTTFITHLIEHVPPEMQQQIHFQPLSRAQTVNGVIVYPVGTGGLQVRELRDGDSPNYTVHVSVWHPEGNPTALAPYEAWLWQEFRKWNSRRAQIRGVQPPPEPEFDALNQWLVTEAHRRFQDQVTEAAASKGGGAFAGIAAAAGAPAAVATTGERIVVPELEVKREGLGGTILDLQSAIVTGMVVFALYFTCVYLLPTLNCEERERGILLAQALSPASPLEIVTAKALFYPAAGVVLAATIAGIYQPAILVRPFFWMSLVAVAAGFLGIGMTISTLARTQRAAFLGGMCYLMAVSMLLLICSLNNVPFLPYLAVEYFGPRILHAAIEGVELTRAHWGNLLGAAVLGVVWLTVAVRLFRRRGWQ